MSLLSVESVSVDFGGTPAVRDVSFALAAGEVLAVVGESGSGKTVTAMSLLGLLPRTASVRGRALLNGRDLFSLSPQVLRSVRGNEVGLVFQEPMSALNPVFTIGAQIVEAVRAHRSCTRAQARSRALELLRLVGLPVERFKAYPHEMSGGQLQRVVIAMAVANEPSLLIADEPTTALDVTVQAEILDLLRDLRGRLDAAILLITHDMGVVADLADRVVVMRDGVVVETGDVEPLFAAPQAEYTRQLLGSVLSVGSAPARAAVSSEPVLRLSDVSVRYKKIHAVSSVSLEIGRGEVLGLVGESGSGKSSIAGAITGLVPSFTGSITLSGEDISRLRGRALKELRGRIGLVFQDPLSSLNPRATIARSIAQPLLLHTSLRGTALSSRVAELLERVHLDPALAERYPHELSGGQRQRAGIARAIALDPDLLIADEPTSALDVSVQAKILDLFRELQRSLRFACLFISHDLAVVEQLADRVAVLYDGRVVEQGTEVFSAPAEPYTRRLIAAAPIADPVAQRVRRAMLNT
ncbi:putative oligopeptide ABC transporter, ATP-binding protein [Lentzea sp. NBRC 105346]|uniref:dipeptide ABC transporter ATP-binding protein n=1 Tax=Lentzea sp. NBRC 105346 TaxID=3032205 RepID=UPI0024A126F1|nr:ABC transporter ATP-binding protein [Lentzea sp. NBRC 105346]GLZ28486.1 putative oligopeptide ABC transporter, ATP-binding protein [Lentzea sp. NBRC 105346]